MLESAEMKEGVTVRFEGIVEDFEVWGDDPQTGEPLRMVVIHPLTEGIGHVGTYPVRNGFPSVKGEVVLVHKTVKVKEVAEGRQVIEESRVLPLSPADS